MTGRTSRTTRSIIAASITANVILAGCTSHAETPSSSARTPAGQQVATTGNAAAPMLAYVHGTTLLVRDGNTPTTLASLPSTTTIFGLVWSWDASHLAWLSRQDNPDSTQIHISNISDGSTISWACPGCFSATFQNDQVFATNGEDAIAVYPVTGGMVMTSTTISGIARSPDLPAAQVPLDLLGSTAHDKAAIAFAAGGDLPGVDDYLYSVTYTLAADAQASQLGTQQPAAAPGGDRVFGGIGLIAENPERTEIAYGGSPLGGDPCSGSDSVTVVNLSTGTSTTTPLPADTANPLRVSGVWITTDGTIDAAAWTQPGNCPSTGGQIPTTTVAPLLYTLTPAGWHSTDTAVVSGTGGPNGWITTTTGTVTVTAPTISTINPIDTTASNGYSDLDLGSDITDLTWAPTPQ